MLHYLSGEFLLKSRSNSGAVVIIRSFFIACLVYGAAIAIKSAVDPSTGSDFSSTQLRFEVASTIPWFGAIFAGVYVALYTRFASQWSYLAGVYNDMMATSAQNPDPVEAQRALCLWQAGFIEDADDLHLARQPLFAAVIKSMLAKTEVRNNFVKYSGGERRYERLLAQTKAALTDAATRR